MLYSYCRQSKSTSLAKSLARMDFTLKIFFMTIMAIKVNCYSSGALAESCDILSSNSTYRGAVEQTIASIIPFEIDTSMFKNPFSDDLHYIPNSSYQISLRPKRCSITFRGFLIQAVLADDNITVVGSFATPSLEDNYQLSYCEIQEGTVTHSSETDKTSVSIWWTSPLSSTGNIRFRFKTLLSSNVYWDDKMTTVLVERQCPIPLYWASVSNSCVIQCPLFTFGNHSLAECQPFPSILHKHVQADATAYFGSVQVTATPGTKIFSFRVIISLSKFGNDLDAIVISLVRSNLVERIFSFSDGQTQRAYSIGFKGGIDAVNASGVFPEIRLIENRLVVLEDSVIYQEPPSTELELPTVHDFDLNLIVVGRYSITIEQFFPFAVGTVAITLPLDECQNDTCTSENTNFGDFNCSQIDSCEPNPCQNDAVCTNNIFFECFCNERWMDTQCEPIIDYCASDTPIHGPCNEDSGTIACADESPMYSCICAAGFTGHNCSEDIDECDPNPCQNGAICINLLHGEFQCLCSTGWTGQLCESDIDYCASDSSLHGPCDDTGAINCADANSTYVCTCAFGFTGNNCSQDIDECEPDPCQNNANCMNLPYGLFECNCYSGWSGQLCEIDIDYCALDSSVHGPCDDTGARNCTDGNSTYSCECAVGYTGYNCSQDINECDPNPCQNGATCINLLQGEFQCLCNAGWTGELCDIDINHCALNSSLHGPCDDTGTISCTDGNLTYSCTCKVGFTGYNCSEDIDECDLNPCQNGGNCTNLLYGMYTCECPSGFSGETCDTFSDPCTPSQPCGHEMNCTSEMYNCNCSCISQCPLFTFGNHSTGYCQPFPEDFGGVQTNATTYYGRVDVNAANGTIVFSFELITDLGQFNNDTEIIEVTLTQGNLTGPRLFSLSNYQQQRHFSISKHGGINSTFVTNRIVVYNDNVIYNSYKHDFLSNIKLPSTVELYLSVAIRGNDSENTAERIQFAVASVTLIQDPPQVNMTWCLSDIDDTWSIVWPRTSNSSSASQPCPGINTTGKATRYCDSNGQWREADVMGCSSIEILELQDQIESILYSEEQVFQIADLTQLLSQATQPQNQSLLPNDLQASSEVLSTVVDILEANNITSNNVIDVFNNVLDDNNREGWKVLQANGMVMTGELLLQSAEQYALLVAMSANMIEEEQGVKVFRQSRQNIVITGRQYNTLPSTDVHFPDPLDLINYTKSDNISNIRIPSTLIQERLNELKEGENLPVSFSLLRNLPVSNALSNTSANSCSTANHNVMNTMPELNVQQNMTPTVTSDVVAAQVGATRMISNSQHLQMRPICLNFTFEMTLDSTSNYSYQCAYWNFSYPVGNGSWVTDGVTTTAVDVAEGNSTSVQCSSAHLTSFAVLVTVAGGLEDIDKIEHTALKVVSYIGCTISIGCLMITVVFFIWRGKLFNSRNVLFFIHFNLAVSLLVAILTFVLGIETASGNAVGCAFVAALLHYLFLSAFCWMLCEGIMLYLLLHIVFSNMAKKRWPFILIGYLTPLPIVIITIGIRHKDYGVRDECGNLLYCWLSIQHGTIFGFVAPMLAIIAINALFLVLALHAVWETKKRSLTKLGNNDHTLKVAQTLGRSVFVGSLVLLPLLGLTWIFGILAVNANSTAFAWLFTIFNSTQGLFILVLHVIQSNEVRSKISSKLLYSKRRTTLRSTTYARWRSAPHDSIATLSGIGIKETNIDQTKVSSVALATECDNLDERELGDFAMSLEKSDHGFI